MRTTRFTGKIGVSIIRERAAGATVEGAGRKHGVSPSTLYLWLSYGDAGIEPFVAFTSRFRAAKGIADRRFIEEQAALLATA